MIDSEPKDTEAVPAVAAGSSSDMEQWKAVTRRTNVLLSQRLTLESYWTRQTRPDGRLLSQCRPLSITRNVLQKTTHGSSLLTLGATKRVVVAGVVLQVGRIVVPQGGGDVHVTVQSMSSSSSSYSNNQATDTIALQSWLERTLQETLDLQQLVITPSHAFSLRIGLQILDESVGNLRDTCLLAALAAVQCVQLPEMTEANQQSSRKPPTGMLFVKPTNEAGESLKRRIQLPVVPVPLTMGLWQSANKHQHSSTDTDSKLHWVVDPTQVELQHGCCGQLTVVVDAMTSQILQCDLVSIEPVDAVRLALGIKLAQSRAQEMKSQFIEV